MSACSAHARSDWGGQEGRAPPPQKRSGNPHHHARPAACTDVPPSRRPGRDAVIATVEPAARHAAATPIDTPGSRRDHPRGRAAAVVLAQWPPHGHPHAAAAAAGRLSMPAASGLADGRRAQPAACAHAPRLRVYVQARRLGSLRSGRVYFP